MKPMDTGSLPVSAPALIWFTFIVHLASGATLHSRAIRTSRTSDEPNELVIKRERKFRPFGSVRYPDENAELTWGDLSGHSRGKLGHICEPGAHNCGEELVCRTGVCRHCLSNSECPSLYHCSKTLSGENICEKDAKPAWEKVVSSPSHFLCTLLIFFSSVLAAAAGTGGGGMFVPLLVLFAGLKAEAAVPLSQCLILFSSSCNLVVFIAQRHTTFREQPKIDYDCIVVFEPMLCLGVTFGVLLHRMSPQWFLLGLLCITLGMALWRTATKGLQQRAKESEQTLLQRVPSGGLDPAPYLEEISALLKLKKFQLLGIMCCWILMLASSFHGLSPCSSQFGVFFATLAGLLALCTFIATKYIITRPEASQKPMDWTASPWLPTLAFGGGMLGGLLGLGGGVIMSPVLLEVGMHSESVQATTALIVFLSSSLATFQFALIDAIIWHYALWYSCVTVCATILGQHLCEVYVRRTGRYSFITLSIAGVLLFSLVALAFVGTIQVMQDIKYGQQMGFSTTRLCAGGGLGILDVDVTPAQAWPKDIPHSGLPGRR